MYNGDFWHTPIDVFLETILLMGVTFFLIGLFAYYRAQKEREKRIKALRSYSEEDVKESGKRK